MSLSVHTNLNRKNRANKFYSIAPHKVKGEKKEKRTKLKLNLSTLPAPNLEASESSPNTAKTRFKIKHPPPSSTPTTSGSILSDNQPKTNRYSASSSGNGIQSIKISTATTPKVPKPKPKPTTISLSQYSQQHQQQSKSCSARRNNYHMLSPTTSIKLEHQPYTMMLSSPILHQKSQLQQLTQTVSATSAVSNNDYTTTKETKCICENPTVDYDTSMTDCNNRCVWFHDVDIAESQQAFASQGQG